MTAEASREPGKFTAYWCNDDFSLTINLVCAQCKHSITDHFGIVTIKMSGIKSGNGTDGPRQLA